MICITDRILTLDVIYYIIILLFYPDTTPNVPGTHRLRRAMLSELCGRLGRLVPMFGIKCQSEYALYPPARTLVPIKLCRLLWVSSHGGAEWRTHGCGGSDSGGGDDDSSDNDGHHDRDGDRHRDAEQYNDNGRGGYLGRFLGSQY